MVDVVLIEVVNMTKSTKLTIIITHSNPIIEAINLVNLITLAA